jgi:hypothetical protein
MVYFVEGEAEPSRGWRKQERLTAGWVAMLDTEY